MAIYNNTSYQKEVSFAKDTTSYSTQKDINVIDKVGSLSLEIPAEEQLPDVISFINKQSLQTTTAHRDASYIKNIQSMVSYQSSLIEADTHVVPHLICIRHIPTAEYVCLFFFGKNDLMAVSYQMDLFFDKEQPCDILDEGLDMALTFLFQKKKIHRLEVEVVEGQDSNIIIQRLQTARFCFEGIRREAVRKIEGESVPFALATSSLWADVMIFSLLSQEREETTTQKMQPKKEADSLNKDLQLKLIYKARYEGIESIIVRAVIMRQYETLIEETVQGKVSAHDLCLLLLKKKTASSLFQAVEELPGAEVHYQQETIQEALQRIVEHELQVKLVAPVLYLTSFDFTREDGKKVREFVFRISIEGTIAPVLEQYVNCKWVPLQHLVTTPLHPEIMAILFSNHDHIDYITETHNIRDEELILEESRSFISELYDTLAHGLHVNAYAARGFGLQQIIGLALKDKSGHLIGGLLSESQYGAYFCHKLWIDPQFWGRGWEKRVIDRIEFVAKEEGARFVVFSCMDWELIRPLQILGYRIEWQRSGYDRGSRLLYLRKDFS